MRCSPWLPVAAQVGGAGGDQQVVAVGARERLGRLRSSRGRRSREGPPPGRPRGRRLAHLRHGAAATVSSAQAARRRRRPAPRASARTVPPAPRPRRAGVPPRRGRPGRPSAPPTPAGSPPRPAPARTRRSSALRWARAAGSRPGPRRSPGRRPRAPGRAHGGGPPAAPSPRAARRAGTPAPRAPATRASDRTGTSSRRRRRAAPGREADLAPVRAGRAVEVERDVQGLGAAPHHLGLAGRARRDAEAAERRWPRSARSCRRRSGPVSSTRPGGRSSAARSPAAHVGDLEPPRRPGRGRRLRR